MHSDCVGLLHCLALYGELGSNLGMDCGIIDGICVWGSHWHWHSPHFSYRVVVCLPATWSFDCHSTTISPLEALGI